MTYMSATYTMSEARARFAELLDRVEAGEDVEISRHGRTVARLVPPRSPRNARNDHLFAAADRLRIELEEARHRPLSPPLGDVDADAWVAEIRADRDSW